MHIIVPMSGEGKRFLDVGYKVPKPLIKIDGKPIIEHVCNLFPDENKFTFICNSTHLANTNIRQVLLGIKPNANIVEIQNHKKGPVHAVYFAKDLIEDNEEVIVNYCDFGTYWDYKAFLKHTRERNADGAIPSYKGFHPHMLRNSSYAFMRDQKQWMLQIKEKEPFTNNCMEEYASNGTYYFKKGSYVKKYFQDLIDKNVNIKGEYYVSLIYNLLVKDGLKVSIYKIQHMLQWGAPQDVEEYETWSKYFHHAVLEVDKLKPQKYEKIMTVPSDSKGTWIPTDEEWEDVKSAEEPPYDGFEYGDEYGFIAQDVRNIPELSFLVSGEETDADGTQTPLGLNYQGVFVVAVKAIQELKAKNEALEARILALENA